MGVPGLWDIIRPAGQQRSLTHLAVVDGFEGNPAGRRGLRVGIDASIWFYHATYGREGENPELRTLFFRCARLMSKPFLPLFVFDGPKRPKMKRKKKVGGKDHWMVSGMQEIIEAFGFEWRTAPGEAEAELAYLNRIGIIDAIITDDVDTFLFGASMIVRNPGKMLTGNSAHPVKNSAGKDDDEHVYTYCAKDIASHEDIELSVGGLILIGLLRGGDYDPDGLPGCGPNVAHALARCGFGDTLLAAARTLPPERLPAFLANWRHEVRQELKTNARGFLNTKKAKLAQSLPETFPDLDVLLLYTNPVTSERTARPEQIIHLWEREPDLGKLASLCERKFEWGVKEIIIKRFRTVIWAPAVLRILRRAVLDDDERQRKAEQMGGSSLSTPRKIRNKQLPNSPGTPSKMITKHFSSMRIQEADENKYDDDDRLIVKIHSKREHASTDCVPEYRLEIAPAQLVRLTESGVQGLRQLPTQGADGLSDEDFSEEEDEEGGKVKKKKGPPKSPPPPDSCLRVWMPASMVRIVEPDLVDEFEGLEEQKRKKKTDAAKRKAARAQGLPVPRKMAAKSIAKSAAKSAAGKKKLAVSDEESSDNEDFSDVFKSKKGSGKGSDKFRWNKEISPNALIEEEEETDEDVSPERIAESLSVGAAGVAHTASIARRDLQMTKTTSVPTKKKEAPRAKTNLSNALKRNVLLEVLNRSSSQDSATTSKSNSRETSVFSRASSATSAASSARQLAAPFPMHLTDSDNDSPSKPHRTDPTLPAALKSAARKQSSRTSDSDSASLLSSPKKSPRKSKSHTSPNLKGRLPVPRFSTTGLSSGTQQLKPLLAAQARKTASARQEEEEDSSDTGGRSKSPSPLRSKVAQKPFKGFPLNVRAVQIVENIIEISSDSDASPPRLAPAKPNPSRSAKPVSSENALCKKTPKPMLLPVSRDMKDVIDLT